jgi:hypothetical protein
MTTQPTSRALDCRPIGRGRVIYLCDWTGPSGGIQVLYEHVRLLRQLGVDAMLGAPGPFRRCDWFANDPAQSPGIADCLGSSSEDDVLVMPEICVGAPQLDGVRARRVAFVQNPSLLRGRLDDYAGAIVPGHALVPWLQAVSGFSGEIAVVPGFLHAELVRAGRTFTSGRPRVLIVDRPDKHRGEPADVARALCGQPHVDVTYVDRPLPRTEFTELFCQHDVYLHLSWPEGFPISILEAFGAGCLVAGFAGRGGLEFMRDGDNCFVVADGDRDGVVAALARVLATPRPVLDAMLRRALATARNHAEQRTSDALSKVFATPAVRSPA